jgi:hypothetical protein
MATLLHALYAAFLATSALALIICLGTFTRIYPLWKARRGVTLSLPFSDLEELRFRVAEAFKFVGQPTPSSANGSFAIEPTNWRKKFGLRPITVSLIQPNLALISSQGSVLNAFARSQKLPVVPDPNNTFAKFLKRKAKWFYLPVAGAFAVVFVLVMVNDPQGEPTHAKPSPIARSYAPAQDR